jgi:TonB family protein
MSSSLWPSALSSLDDSLGLYRDSLGKLKAATAVDIDEVIEHLELAVEFAADLRALISSELPGATWETREELDALIEEEIESSQKAKDLEERRLRLLSLATELERGSIVHRRAIRVEELNQFRGQAVSELRSQADMEEAAPVLPGPDAREWVSWACALQEPEDTESIKTLRERFTQVDNFIANLEPNMWVPAKGPIPEISLPPAPAKKPATVKKQPQQQQKQVQQPQVEPNGFDESVVSSSGPLLIKLRAPKFSRGRNRPPVRPSADELPSALKVDTAAQSSPSSQTEAQERPPQTSMTSVIADPMVADPMVADPVVEVEPPAVAEVSRATSAAPAIAQPKPAPPVTVEALRATFAAAALKTDVDEHPVRGEAAGHTGSPSATVKGEGEPFTARVVSKAQAITADIRTKVEELDKQQRQILLAAIVAVVLLAVLGTVLLWKSHGKHVQMAAQAVAQKAADVAQTAATSPSDQAKLTESQPHAGTGPADPKGKDQGAAPKPTTTADVKPAKPIEVPKNAPAVKKDDKTLDVAPKSLTEVAGGLPVPNNVNNIVNNMPVAQPKIAPTPPKAKVSVISPVVLVHQVPPQYPLQAKVAGIHGTVVLQAVIAKNGSVKSVHVLNGNPLLTQAALDAVKQWQYKPSTLDGQPIEADTQISVSFKNDR